MKKTPTKDQERPPSPEPGEPAEPTPNLIDPTPQIADHPDGGACVLCLVIKERLFGEGIAHEHPHSIFTAKQAVKRDSDSSWMKLCTSCALFVHGWGMAHAAAASRLIVPPTPGGVPILKQN